MKEVTGCSGVGHDKHSATRKEATGQTTVMKSHPVAKPIMSRRATFLYGFDGHGDRLKTIKNKAQTDRRKDLGNYPVAGGVLYPDVHNTINERGRTITDIFYALKE